MGPARTGVVRAGAGGSGGEVEDQQASGGAETGGDNGGGAGRGAAGHPVGGVEGAADVEAAATHGHVLDPGVGPALEGGDPGAVAEAQLGQALLGDPVDLVKLPPANACRPSGGGQRLDLGVDHGRERRVDRPGGCVEGEDVAAGNGRGRRVRAGDLGELAPATILFPIWTMAATLPSRTCGVQSAGLLDTTTGCGTFAAAPGCAMRPTRSAADSSTNRTRRPMWDDSPLTSSGTARL